jgi:hypothetical protein
VWEWRGCDRWVGVAYNFAMLSAPTLSGTYGAMLSRVMVTRSGSNDELTARVLSAIIS